MTSQAVLLAAASTRTEADVRAARDLQNRERQNRETLESLRLAGARAARIEDHLPPGKTYEEALARARARKEHLWSARPDLDEDERIAELERFCTALARGHAMAGRQLATDALWA